MEHVCTDAVVLLRQLVAERRTHSIRRFDACVLSPPWGGPQYLDRESFKLTDIELGDCDGAQLLTLALEACGKVVYLLPRNLELNSLRRVLEDCKLATVCTVQSVHIHKKLKMKIAYVGDGWY
jgi:hypothetical protein